MIDIKCIRNPARRGEAPVPARLQKHALMRAQFALAWQVVVMMCR
jgi:hypothetical protein